MSTSNDPEWLAGQREKLERAKAALELDIAFWKIVDGPDPMDELAGYRDAVEQEEARASVQVEYDRMLLRVADHLNKPPHEIAPDRFIEDPWWRVKRQVRIAGRWVLDALDLLDFDPPRDSDL